MAEVCDLGAIEPAAWDRLVPPNEPFMRHAFLHALAQSGSVGPGTGWLPRHLTLRTGETLVAALPCYEKTDSYGEFIFDWAWAEGAARAGLAYYPKLVAAVPFTPAGGARLLVAEPSERGRAVAAVAEVFAAWLAAGRYSSVHVLFCSPEEQRAWQAAGFLPRSSWQFHWQRLASWQTFDDFLAALRHANRKQVRKERARARAHGFALAMERVADLPPSDHAALYALYRQTVWEKGAHAYLTPAFFAALPQAAPAEALVATARAEGHIVAMALFFCRGRHLYGRYWGAREAWDALHFELCYYLPIEWALAHGIERFEAGAQGEHKLKRGLLPSPCQSAHRFAEPALGAAVAAFCRAEADAVAAQMAAYLAHSPFRAEAPLTA